MHLTANKQLDSFVSRRFYRLGQWPGFLRQARPWRCHAVTLSFFPLLSLVFIVLYFLAANVWIFECLGILDRVLVHLFLENWNLIISCIPYATPRNMFICCPRSWVRSILPSFSSCDPVSSLPAECALASGRNSSGSHRAIVARAC